MPVAMPRQTPLLVQRVQKSMEMPVVQFSDRVVDMLVVTQRQVPMIPNVQNTVEVPQIQYVDKIVDAPVEASHQPVPGRESFPLRPSLLRVLTGCQTNTVSLKG